MKRILLLLLAVGMVNLGWSQCTEVFISEYVEGMGNDKALELYNPTSSPISLDGYELQRFSNGATTPAGGILDLSGNTIPPLDVLVVVNGQTTFELGGTSPPADPALQALADVLDNPWPAVTYMNGNDAVVLVKDGAIVDIFGKVGQDPGGAWTDDASAGFTDANGGAWWTRDHTLIRKPSVDRGFTDFMVPEFNVTLEYDSLPEQTWTMLGAHDCVCNTVSVEEEARDISKDVFMFPNPVTNGQLTLLANSDIEQVIIYDLTGKVVSQEVVAKNISRVAIDVTERHTGIYLVRTVLEGGHSTTKKVTIR